MNYIVYHLIKTNLKSEECFWILVHLVENVMPINYYTSMEDIIIDINILKTLLKIHIPVLSAFLQAKNVDLSILTIKWFICLFTNSDLNEQVLNILISLGSFSYMGFHHILRLYSYFQGLSCVFSDLSTWYSLGLRFLYFLSFNYHFSINNQNYWKSSKIILGCQVISL